MKQNSIFAQYPLATYIMKSLKIVVLHTFVMIPFFISPQISKGQSLSLEDIFLSNKYKDKRPENLDFMLQDNFYTVQEGNAIIKKETVSGKTIDTLISKTDTLLHHSFKLAGYSFAEDEKQLLLWGNHQGIYRRSFLADYILFNPANPKNFTVLPKISYATFSPDGQKLAYVKDNNLYYYDIKTQEHVAVTTDGAKNAIINGSTDWVYEEEFEFTKAFFWSPNNQQLAFYRFDETRVPEYNMQKWEGLYPTEYRFKYPKAGEDNAIISIKVYDLATKNTQTIPVDAEKAYYVPRISWAPSGVLQLRTLNRMQTLLSICHFNMTTNTLQTIYEEENRPVEIHDDVFYVGKKNEFLITSEKEGADKIFLTLYPENKSCKFCGDQLPQIKGLETVNAYDAKQGWIYYTFSTDAINKHIGRVSLTTKKIEPLSFASGTHSVQVSKGGNYYILTHHSAGNPSTTVLYDARTKKAVKTLEDNAELRSKLSQQHFAPQEFFHFRTTENIELNGWLIKPKDFDSTKRYPLILFTYGGPGSQMVTNAWTGNYYLWNQYLSKQGFIVACVDGRGTGGKSTFFRTNTYKRLGELETKDQIEAAKYLTSLPYVNRDKIGIWGWSFGGYLATNCLLKGNDIFKAAIAVAPVTNWRFYDTIYTERYLSTPQDNAVGYDQNSPLLFADRLKGNYLLIHGTSDDNVHVQNAYAMQEALVKAGKQFDMFIYSNKAHGISGGNTRWHLYTLMAKFWNEKLKN